MLPFSKNKLEGCSNLLKTDYSLGYDLQLSLNKSKEMRQSFRFNSPILHSINVIGEFVTSKAIRLNYKIYQKYRFVFVLFTNVNLLEPTSKVRLGEETCILECNPR